MAPPLTPSHAGAPGVDTARRVVPWFAGLSDVFWALVTLVPGAMYLAGTPLAEWIDREFEQGRTGRLGLVMQVPANVWAWTFVGIGLIFTYAAYRAFTYGKDDAEDVAED